ncbi:MAG: sensor domain-containing diguanylate cyclase [Candidatus Gastranaerophilales bacterium]|nr:sensor domain-containing diguanylate cyclase [Candidatus Gastranaerophilales bacterium]
MQTFNDSKKVIELTFLWEVARALNENISSEDLIKSIKTIFCIFFKINYLKILLYEENFDTFSDFSRNWNILSKVDDKERLINFFKVLIPQQGRGFLINDSLVKFDNKEKVLRAEISKIIKDNKAVLVLPITDKNEVIGLIELQTDEFTPDCQNLDFIMSLNIAATQISTAIINNKLNYFMQQNVEFYKAMKDIAKLIESQYELNYILPLIGESISKFAINKQISIFYKDENSKYKLLWPKKYCYDGLNNLLKKNENALTYNISNDGHFGVFPLLKEGINIGVVLIDGKNNKLDEKDIFYMEQLIRQSNITVEKAEYYAETLKQATIDALTGLNNRRQFETRLEQEINIAKRKKSHLCFMLLDIDYFKSVNDTFGHLVGDEILYNVAKIIREEIRTYDIAARYGGEEFCLLLPDTTVPKALLIANRLRERIEKSKFDISSFNLTNVKNVSITISIGISVFDPKYPDFTKIFKEADSALYKAKQEGRNRVILFSNQEL